MSQQIFNKMNKQQQFPLLLPQLNNLPLHLLLTILPYLDRETKLSIKKNSTLKENNDQTFLKLISLSLFSEKYLTSTDRSVYMSFFSDPTILEYENIFLGEICVRDPKKYFQLEKSLELLLKQMGSELKNLQGSQTLIQFLQNTIRDPEIPLPRMRKEGKAMHCNSALQFGLADLRNVDEDGQQEEYIEDCILDLQEFLESRQSTIQKIVQERKGRKIKGKNMLSAIKQCYYHPELINIQNYKQYVIDQLINYNMFIYVHALVSGVAQIFHEYIVDQGKQFERFIEFNLRYSIYRSIVLTLQQSKISAIVYEAMRKLINQVQQLNSGLKINNNEQGSTKLTLEQDVIFQVDTKLENRKSNESSPDQGNQYFKVREKRQNVFSQITAKLNGDMHANQDTEMSCRMFMAGGKIWVNQCRKIRQKYEQEIISPSKHLAVSQQKINYEQYLKIFNRLSYANIIQRLSKEIQQIEGEPQKKKQPVVLRDQDIINVFGFNSNANNSSQQFTYSFNQPSTTYDFDQTRSKSIQNDQSYHYRNALLNVENKIRMHPYRHASPRVKKCNDSKSPQKEYESMAQIQMFTLKQLPSLKQRKLLSRASMLSKYSKISDLKGISFIEDLFESQIPIQEQILMDFFSFLIDLSVNECTVHWCGHSDQFLMGDYYRTFQDYAIKYNIGFMEHLSKLAQEACSQLQIQNKKLKKKGSNEITENTTQKVLKNLLKWHLQYLDMGYLHKTTIKKLLKKGNEILERIHILHQTETKQKQFQPIKLSIDEINKIIQYYNEEMWKIQRNVSEDKLKIYEERRFYKNIIRVPRFQELQDYKEREEKQYEKNKLLERSQEIFIQKEHKKLERRRRNSEKVSPLPNEQ